MGVACSTHGRGKKLLQIFLSQNLKGRDLLGDESVDKKITLKWVLKRYIQCDYVGWVHLAETDQWRARVNTVTKFGLRKMREI
jgi:hypothetical protein